ncbi:T9SS type A sorting domain-containing protein [Hymenobacter sp. BT635]|uniref:T9SS type A sorting domain-containing protein n=1 Tax=Hymenobacter nitidus TaxID=2880929 RepID=A0ABS8AC79_9BACT|nr:T9SS type A sorting domain-containing protein [Hymenobacter nitidus]MCB2377896.1 T9SS type A sorting domain-containing protein [Hymenobacter nitidus]
MSVLSPNSSSAPQSDTPVIWSLWGRFFLLLSLLLMARASRAQSPDSENGSFPAVADLGRGQAARARFTYYDGSRCAGTAGMLVPTVAVGAAAGTFSASPAGLRLNPLTGAIDLAQSQPGTYTIINQLADATSASTSLELHALPAPTLAASGPTTFAPGGAVQLIASGGTPGATYQFFNNGQAISGATANKYTATASGSYTVLVINPGSCVAASAPVAVTVAPANGPALTKQVKTTPASSARPAAAGVVLNVFPNPNTGSFTVAVTGSSSPTELAVFTTLGEKVQSSTLPLVAGTCNADLSHLAPGVYILRATTAAGTISRRVVRE